MIQSNWRKNTYHMDYFNIKRSIFIVSSNKWVEEYEKIDKFIEILNKSGIGKLIENTQKILEEEDIIHLI